VVATRQAGSKAGRQAAQLDRTMVPAAFDVSGLGAMSSQEAAAIAARSAAAAGGAAGGLRGWRLGRVPFRAMRRCGHCKDRRLIAGNKRSTRSALAGSMA
jgi:membrane protein YqaA with SNARE-associated domain